MKISVVGVDPATLPESIRSTAQPRPVNSFVSSSLALQCRACAAISIFLCFGEVQSEAACRAYCNAKRDTSEQRETTIENRIAKRSRLTCVGVFVFGGGERETFRGIQSVRVSRVFPAVLCSVVYFFELCCFVASFLVGNRREKRVIIFLFGCQ